MKNMQKSQAESLPVWDASSLETTLAAAHNALKAAQREDGHFSYEFEADATIPAEYILLVHYLGETPDASLEAKITAYLKQIQNEDGGWPLFHRGAFDMSASVKAYFALKMMGESIDSAPMIRARECILRHGGAEMSNVFTRFTLALYGVIGWKAVPIMPVEIMLLPKWFPFHMYKIAYWARTTLAPMLVLQALKPQAKNPRGIGIDELFITDPASVGPRPRAEHQHRGWFTFFAMVDAILRKIEPYFPAKTRTRAIEKTVAFITERLNGVHGVGAIFPPMAGSVMMFAALGRGRDDAAYAMARESVEKLLIIKDDSAYCQPCVSPVWDTALAAHSLLEEEGEQSQAMAKQALDWLLPLQELEVMGDWAQVRPNVRPGGWAFQYANPHYPDLDDTAVVVMAMDRIARLDETCRERYTPAIERAVEWIEGLQCKNGGWASFDADNTAEYLNNIPFSDHGALLDPPTSDVTARCISMLAQLGHTTDSSSALKRGVDFLLREQEADGSWWGRWGMNYIYGTWSACCALNAIGMPHEHEVLTKAANWLLSIQNADGGWGEDGASYKLNYAGYEAAPSTPSQTSWAVLALMAVGQGHHPAVARGVAYLQATQLPSGGWDNVYHNAPGFPRIFYLHYHGYAQYFTLWALSRFRALTSQRSDVLQYGM
ncbi:MAG: squalene--hopene cyclase [Rickettsiales bacterium]|nr:squalene--hopene cyclase [Rickettsiales bacterium]